MGVVMRLPEENRAYNTHTIVEGIDMDDDGGVVEIDECSVCLGPLFVTCPGERPKSFSNVTYTKIDLDRAYLQGKVAGIDAAINIMKEVKESK